MFTEVHKIHEIQLQLSLAKIRNPLAAGKYTESCNHAAKMPNSTTVIYLLAWLFTYTISSELPDRHRCKTVRFMSGDEKLAIGTDEMTVVIICVFCLVYTAGYISVR